jgi:hypothetical protein
MAARLDFSYLSLCSRCATGFGDPTEVETTGDRILVTFKCNVCGHAWTEWREELKAPTSRDSTKRSTVGVGRQ